MNDLPSATSLKASDVARLLTERIPDLNLTAATEIVNAMFDPENGIIARQLQRPDPAEAAVTFKGFGTFQRVFRFGAADPEEGVTLLNLVKFTPATALKRHVGRSEV